MREFKKLNGVRFLKLLGFTLYDSIHDILWDTSSGTMECILYFVNTEETQTAKTFSQKT